MKPESASLDHLENHLMTTKNPVSQAEIIDKITQRGALAALVLALVTASSAATYLVSPETGWYLEITERVLAVLVVLIILAGAPLMIRKIRLRRKNPGMAPESFITDVARQAMTVSWSLTFLTLVFLDLADGRYVADLPSLFIMDLAKTIMLGAFAVSFFILNRSSGMDELSEGFNE